MSKPILKLQGVSRQFQAGTIVQALNNVDLTVAPGEFVLILGPSGSGKSTLLSLMGGLDKPSAGTIVFDEQPIQTFGENQLAHLRRQKVGFVFQFFNLLETLTALDNVSLPLKMNGIAQSEAEARATEMLGRVGLQPRMQHYPTELSGGEQQRVAIARALINQPRLVLADEPTGNLDSSNAALVMRLLETFNREEGQTIITVSHDPTFKSIAHRVVYMLDGQIERIERVS